MFWAGGQRAWLGRDGGTFSESKREQAIICFFLYDPRNKSFKCNQCDHAFAPALLLKKHEKRERRGQKVLDGSASKQWMSWLIKRKWKSFDILRWQYQMKWQLKSLLWESLFRVFCQVTMGVIRPGRLLCLSEWTRFGKYHNLDIWKYLQKSNELLIKQFLEVCLWYKYRDILD